MTSSPPNDVTQMLIDWSSGDKAALDKLIPIIYQELRSLARHYMSHERPGHTLQTTALVNEAYLRLIGQRDVKWQNRAHFFGVAAQMMRRILVDHARSINCGKRGSGALKVSLEEVALLSEERAEEVLMLHEALTSLEALDPRKSRIVELRYFGGLTVEEVAEILGTSPVTVMRDWRAAKAWLYRAISKHVTP
jgi:RNA polymerase sigma factor (TIGR02999 family)